MAGSVDITTRDRIVTAFRERVCERMEITPFPHQRSWWLASEGKLLVNGVESNDGVTVQLADETIQKWATVPREGGRARFLADLGAFKIGKSFSSALWAAGFAAVPDGRVSLVALEYDTCSPEFDYLCEFLLSERGMGMKYKSLANRARDGKMWLDLDNGMHYEARSWERKESLKGKELDAYVYCLPLDAPVWMGDYSFKSLKDVKIGEVVISGKAKTDVTTRHKLQRAIVTATHRTRKEVLKITLASGRVIYGTTDHKWANGADGDTAARNRYVLPEIGRSLARVIDDPGTCADEKLAGWLAGMYDGEGCRTMICQSVSYNPEVYVATENRLQQAGFNTSRQPDGVRWLGGRQAAVKFVNQIPSIRYRSRYADEAILTHRYKIADEIVAIESVGVQDVGCITTTTGNFIAYGYQTSNCEAYQLPGIECFTNFSQNLRARRGYAVFATTPDRPWIKQLHELGHGKDSEWHCTCNVAADVNPHTFDARAKTRDENLMTREKFSIHYMGQLGDFVGKVFNYDRDSQKFQFSAQTHPALYNGGSDREHLHVPDGWDVVGAVDTGTFYTALLVAFSPGGDAFVLDEYPNYRYVAGLAERDENITIPEWSRRVLEGAFAKGGRSAFWADKNSQFKRELAQYGMALLPASLPLETRTEITREYFQHNKVWLAPWLQVLPFEIENACWPDEATAAGKFQRMKDRDHTLDCLEHILARRPQGKHIIRNKPNSWLEGFVGPNARRTPGNEHMGKF